MTSVSAGHIILSPTQRVGSGRPQRGSNPGPPQQESRALPTELPPPSPERKRGNEREGERGREEEGERLRGWGDGGGGGRRSRQTDRRWQTYNL